MLVNAICCLYIGGGVVFMANTPGLCTTLITFPLWVASLRGAVRLIQTWIHLSHALVGNFQPDNLDAHARKKNLCLHSHIAL